MGKRGGFLLSYICGPFFRFFLQFCDSHISFFEMPCSFILRYLDVCFCWCVISVGGSAGAIGGSFCV